MTRIDSKVLQFPVDGIRKSIQCEKIFRQILENSGCSPEMIKTICARMEEFRKIIDLRIEFSPLLPPLPKELREAVDEAIKKELKKMADQIHNMTNELLNDRFQLEVDLYELRHEED